MPDKDPATGKFLPGNSASPGRPPRKVEDDLHTTLVEALRPRWKKVTDAMIKQAEGGDVPAARFLAEYSIGKPIMRLAFELSPDEQAVITELHAAAKAAEVDVRRV